MRRSSLTRRSAVTSTIAGTRLFLSQAACASFPSEHDAASEAIRSIDWSTSTLGPIAHWPVTLKLLLQTILRSRQPTALWWGPDLLQFHNAAYIEQRGLAPPDAMGKPAAERWAEIWPMVAGEVEAVMTRGESFWDENRLVPVPREGKLEDRYWTYGLSPVIDENGAVGGTLLTLTETTHSILSDRREKISSALGDLLALAASETELSAGACILLERFASDMPLVLLYDSHSESRSIAELSASTRIYSNDSLLTADMKLRMHLAAAPDALYRLHHCVPVHLVGMPVEDRRGATIEDWYFVPLGVKPGAVDCRFVAFGLNPRLAFDQDHRHFLEQLAVRISHGYARIESTAQTLRIQGERDSLLMQAPVAIAVLLGPEMVFSLTNPLYCQLTGRKNMVGRTYAEAFPELAHSKFPGILDAVYRTGVRYIGEETGLMLDRSGTGELEERHVQFNLEPMISKSGHAFGIMAIAVDLTDQVNARHLLAHEFRINEAKLEQLVAERTLQLQDLNVELAASRDEARSASRAKSAFLANMSHEIRTPMNAIVGLTHLMARQAVDPVQQDSHAKVLTAATHLLGLIDDILDLSKIEAGKLVLEKVEFSTATILSKIRDIVGIKAIEKGLDLSIDVKALPRRLVGDPLRLSQILINLLSNAVKFTESGSIRLVGRAMLTVATRVLVRFDVKDTGPGVPLDRQATLFDAFEQADTSTTRRHGGTGLGLAVTRQLSRQMGGDTGVISDTSGGSTFWFTAWLATPGGDHPDEPLRSAPSPATSPEPALSAEATAVDVETQLRTLHRYKRVLLAEDNPVNQFVAAQMLRAVGLSVDTVGTGTKAVEMVLADTYDLVLMDMQMPGMDGVDAARRIRSAGVDVPVIAMTANAYVEDRMACMEAGMDDHIAKPVTPAVLYATVLRWLEDGDGPVH